MSCFSHSLRGRSCLCWSARQVSCSQGSRWPPSCLFNPRWQLHSLKNKRQPWWPLNCLLGHSCPEEQDTPAPQQIDTGWKKCDVFLYLSHLPLHPQMLWVFLFLFLPFFPLVASNRCLAGFWGHCSQLEALFFSLTHHKFPRHLVG